jgi:hypothetical protein
LADFQQLSEENDGYRYLLVGVDVLSRMVFGVPIKSKSTNDMKKGFEKLFKHMPNLPAEIFSDLGKEYESNEMRHYFALKGIKKQSSRTGDTKAAVAERFIRTIKDRIYRWFSEKNTLRWIDVVPKVIESLNNTRNIATGIIPNQFTPEMTRQVWDRLYSEHMNFGNNKIKRTRYKEGDAVRLAKAKRTFDKGYWPRFTDEIFTVKSAVKAKPNFYLLKDHEGEEIMGRVYEPELSKTRMDKETTYRVEEVLEKRKRKGQTQLLVKFIGYKKPNGSMKRTLLIKS